MKMNKVTIYDIARELNVSTATINRALNNKSAISPKTKARILAKAEEMGYVGNKAAKSLARRPIHLDFIIYNKVPVFHNDIIAGARKAFEDLRDFNVMGEIHIFEGMEYEVHQKIIAKMQELYEVKHDGLLLLGTFDSNGIREILEQCTEKGIHTAVVNGDIAGIDRTFAVRQNAILAGRLAAELLYWFTGNGTVAVFTGRPDVKDHSESVTAFCEECKRRSMNLAAVYENHDDEGFAAYNTERLIKRHPDVTGLYVNTANSISVCKKLKELGMDGKIKVVTSDLFDELRGFMKEDVIQATIFQDPFKQGYTAVEKMFYHISESLELDSTIFIQPSVILQSNIID